MYADDTVLFANSKDNLQRCLDDGTVINGNYKLMLIKIKIVIFSKQKDGAENTFVIGAKEVEVVEEFKYLGVTFKFNGHFNNNFEDLKEKGNRAMRSVVKKARRDKLPIDLQFDLFDKMVMPVILYGCEIWGYKNLGTLENLHLKFCKLVMNLKL